MQQSHGMLATAKLVCVTHEIWKFLSFFLLLLSSPRSQIVFLDRSGRSIHCVSKKNIPDVFSYNSRKQYLAERLLRKQAIIYCYIFPPHVINASTLPCETENTEIVCFHVNVAC